MTLARRETNEEPHAEDSDQDEGDSDSEEDSDAEEVIIQTEQRISSKRRASRLGSKRRSSVVRGGSKRASVCGSRGGSKRSSVSREGSKRRSSTKGEVPQGDVV